MSDDSIEYTPIGTICSPFATPEGIPIQPRRKKGPRGIVCIDEQFAPGLADLEGFSHCILIYHFHKAPASVELTVTPFLDTEPRGLFATRAPTRPNRIGMSIVAIESIEEHEVHVTGIDVVDGTPLLDIKPFVAQFDLPEPPRRGGWIDATAASADSTRADDRFVSLDGPDSQR